MSIDKETTRDTLHRLVAVLLHFRTQEMTLLCLTSLWSEGVREVVLLDNSDDGGTSIATVRARLTPMQELGLTVHFLDFGKNLGFAAGVNCCIDHALKLGAARILLINSDARMTSESIANLDRAISSGADVAFPTVLVSGREEDDFFYQRYLALVFPRRLPGSFRIVNGVCVLVSERYASAHLLDEAFFFYGEDVEFGYRLTEKHVKISKVSSSVITHEKSSSAKNGSLFYEYHIVRGHLLLARRLSKNRFDCVIALLGRCVTLPVRASIRSVRSMSFTPLIALCMAVGDAASGHMRTLTPAANSTNSPSLAQ